MRTFLHYTLYRCKFTLLGFTDGVFPTRMNSGRKLQQIRTDGYPCTRRLFSRFLFQENYFVNKP